MSSQAGGGVPVLARAIRKSYPAAARAIHALRGVDLAIPAGQLVCVMGPSGSGKSTLIRILAGLTRPDEGSVRVGGTELTALGPLEVALFRRRHIGVVLQSVDLVPSHDIESNIAVAALLDRRPLAVERPRIGFLAELFGVRDRLHDYPTSLSAGELRRVALARALFVEPRLLLADEPTADLDARAGEEVLSHLRERCDAHGATTLLATHDLRACSYADRVVVLRDGLVAEDLPARRHGRIP